MQKIKPVGWFGLGSMGLPMAVNLQKKLQSHGANLTFSNRTVSKGAALVEAGAVAKNNIVEVAQICDDIFTMVSADAVLQSLVEELLASGIDLSGKTFIDCSTIHPNTAGSVSETLQKAGATFIAAPVFGANPVAQAGRLIFAMAGPTATIERLEPLVVDVMGRKVINMGEDVKKAPMLKVTGNVLLVVFLEAIAETQVLAEQNGIGSNVMEDLIFENFGPVLGSYSRRLTSGSWAPKEGTAGFMVSNTIKDAKHALRVANDLGVRMPALDIATNNMLSARAYGGENLDGAALYGTLRAQSGLPFWSENSRQE
ncbi:NAD binding domain of 6-phosphogluconate dehydrogenase-domain-containing protein [Colletotrichum godetiae]|uniref:NAD binding domain of 6-phosphogluconate dehydrogenase-domain-containing protein n=1 Tax=Colletotrichum godetiae TaxID=1209918 RepID=A0AAJ0ENR6_9PEZI|nr:NAD binding domain of 6-phosphogluconate dehydrogenase-domain-containing protein [Colletotrichum godetiae]KAK1658891.1 NAD binding domain of 6-phosphogluconate dehydrogenase-domain-containing protein [Colletotrichum godetiae]